MRNKTLVAVIITLIVLALPQAAGAQATPTDDVYRKNTVQQQGSDPGLPLTGLDLAIVVLAGATLIGTGVAVRRASRSG
jgi:hypothetical protein